MIRHGERADNVPYEAMGIEMEEIQDPPLTPRGIDQAICTGKFFKQYFEENGYTDIVIESSPFLRSLQTASEVAKILGTKEIKINYLLSEWMKHSFFTSNPIHTLLLTTKGQEYIEQKYLGGVALNIDLSPKR